MRMERIFWVVLLIIFLPLFYPHPLVAKEEPCIAKTVSYGNLIVETYSTECHVLTPFYWSKAVTISGAESQLKQRGITPLSIITGGFNTNQPNLREPVDYVEIEDKVIVGRSDSWPIIFESKTDGKIYIGIARGEVFRWKFENGQWRPEFRDLPEKRRWAIAAGPWIKIKTDIDDKNGFIVVQFFGNEPNDKPWLEYIYRRKDSTLVFVKSVDHRKNWNRSHRRLIFDWTHRRAVLLNKDGTAFAIVKGRADALSIGKLMAMLGYAEAIMMDGGSATLPSAINPVYLVVTKK
jgi:hypothetical protein